VFFILYTYAKPGQRISLIDQKYSSFQMRFADTESEVKVPVTIYGIIPKRERAKCPKMSTKALDKSASYYETYHQPREVDRMAIVHCGKQIIKSD